MEKKFEVFNTYPYDNETIENVMSAYNWQALKYVLHLTLNNEDMTLDRAKLLYELSQALIMNDVDIVLQRVDGTVYVCMQYEIRTDNGMKRSGLKILWEDRNEYGFVPADKDKQFEILADCLEYIKTEIEPKKEYHTFTCGHCSKEYTALKLRTLMGKPVCDECLKLVCPICGERKEEFVITPCGSYSRICKECYDKNPNGYELCDGCSDKPYCKGKLVDLGELYDVGEERLCEQVAQTRTDIKKCSCCGNYEKVENFSYGFCHNCDVGMCFKSDEQGGYNMKNNWWNITEETEAMHKKIKKIENEFSLNKRLSVSTLEEIGNWIYKYRDRPDRASYIIKKMLDSCFDEYEYFVVWETFKKNVDTDFSETITFLLEKFNAHLMTNHRFCSGLVQQYISDESATLESVNFKRFVKTNIASYVTYIAERILKREIGAPDSVTNRCQELLWLANSPCLDDGYVAFLIGESEVFLEIITTIRNNYQSA